MCFVDVSRCQIIRFLRRTHSPEDFKGGDNEIWVVVEKFLETNVRSNWKVEPYHKINDLIRQETC